MKPLINEYGITIRELKELIKDLPEIDEITGDEYEVWINGTDCRFGFSNQCKAIYRLGRGDIIFEIKGE